VEAESDEVISQTNSNTQTNEERRSQKETITTGYRQEEMARGGLVAFGVGGLRLLTFVVTKRGDCG